MLLIELSQQLPKRKITMVSTVRMNKPELPVALLATSGINAISSKFSFTPTTTLVSYLPKRNKNVVLLSTLHKTAEISDREDWKPAIILEYNHNKGGVDNLDKGIGTHSCRRMTARWPLIIFHNIIDVSSYNAFVIWNKINPTWMSDKLNKRVWFLEQLGKALVTPHIQRRERLPCPAASAALVKAVQRLNLVLIHLRLQLGQARGGDANSVPQRRTVKQILCAAHVKNTSAKSMHTHFHTVLHVKIRVD